MEILEDGRLDLPDTRPGAARPRDRLHPQPLPAAGSTADRAHPAGPWTTASSRSWRTRAAG
ncbi:MAG: hypothetical protein MZU95_10775 [Desulfomicrobium escambiense]|nr:hypothetical protein [Desulfomicrobium escambiense]